MESRWLAVLSLVLLINISLPSPSHSVALRAKSTTKQSHKQTLTKTVVKKTIVKKVASTAKKLLAKSSAKVSKAHRIASKSRTKTRRSVSRRKTVKTVVARRPLGASVWMTPMATTPYTAAVRNRINANFKRGSASHYSPQDMVRAKVFTHYPLQGGIRVRREAVRFLVLHSTETARPADARTIVRSWNNMGRSHPGTQYIVDRDGTIIQTADPNYATIHVNAFTALGGVNNDNSIGIEMVRTGAQRYTQKQLDSVVALADYIKDRYNITQVYGHGQIQPSDRTDPVAFDWNRFSRNLASIHRSQVETETAYHHPSNRTDG